MTRTNEQVSKGRPNFGNCARAFKVTHWKYEGKDREYSVPECGYGTLKALYARIPVWDAHAGQWGKNKYQFKKIGTVCKVCGNVVLDEGTLKVLA
jgi:hypothetical protein